MPIAVGHAHQAILAFAPDRTSERGGSHGGATVSGCVRPSVLRTVWRGPWGDALQPDTGLHLDRTKPPILEIVHDFEQVYGTQPVLYVTEVHEVNEPNALKAVKEAFDWSDLRIYDVNAPGLQHGILLGARRWPS